MAELDLTKKAPSGEKLKREGEAWLTRIKGAERREEGFARDAEIAEKVYSANEGVTVSSDTHDHTYGSIADFNILHSNVETIVPAIYNSTPSPDIRRRFNDEDQGAKDFAEMLERAITVQIDDNALDTEMEREARDSFLSGRGLCRLRFEADEVEPEAGNNEGVGTDELGEVPEPEEFADAPIMENERVTIEAVSWRDFRMGKAKRWENVPWIAYKHAVDREEYKRIKDEDVFNSQFGAQPDPIYETEQDKDNILIWEIWDKLERKVIFLRDDDGAILSKQDDPLELKDFFPMPEPVQPITLTGSMIPVTPYKIYRRLAEELDIATKRIARIMSGLKVRGLFAGKQGDMENVADAEDNTIVYSADLEQWIGNGGLQNAIMWWPNEQAVQALQQLYLNREQTKQAIFEITGISDIVRGASRPSETLGAQEIKTQFGNLRISKYQNMIQRQVRDVFVIMAQIITTRFSGQRLQEMTGVQITPEMEQMFATPVLTAYRVDVESDSTIRADMNKRRGEMTQFLQGTAQYFSTMAPLVAQAPAMGQPAAEIYSAFARHFNLGKQAEDALEQMGQMAKQASQQAQQQQQQPDPETLRAQAEADKQRQQAEIDREKGNRDIALKDKDLQIKQVELETKRAEAAVKGIETQSRAQLAEFKVDEAFVKASTNVEQ